MKKLFALLLIPAVAGATGFTKIIGGKTTFNSYPFMAGVKYCRTQDLVRQLIIPSGNITKAEWFIHSRWIKPGTYTDFKIKLCHTRYGELTQGMNSNYGGRTPIVVYSRATQKIDPKAEAWYGFDFDKPFENKTGINLIVEVELKSPGDVGCFTYWGVRGYNACAVQLHSTSNPGALHKYLHYIRLTLNTMTPFNTTSFGRIKALY